MEPAVKKDKRFTCKDYHNGPGDERWEIIVAVAYKITTAANVRHQRIV